MNSRSSLVAIQRDVQSRCRSDSRNACLQSSAVSTAPFSKKGFVRDAFGHQQHIVGGNITDCREKLLHFKQIGRRADHKLPLAVADVSGSCEGFQDIEFDAAIFVRGERALTSSRLPGRAIGGNLRADAGQVDVQTMQAKIVPAVSMVIWQLHDRAAIRTQFRQAPA